jgi:serine/threonine protein kinase
MGKTLGNWEIVEDLKEAGQSWNYLVKAVTGDPENRRYVLKRLKNPKRLDRFAKEIETLKRLEHKCIAKLVDYNLEDEHPWFVQEYYSGGDLEDFVHRNDPLDPRPALDFLIDIASALQHAHSKGYIHRDIKPANIFLDSKYGPAVLGDFGLVWMDDSGKRLTLTDEAVGSFRYMAPELQDGKVEVPTEACDIYSLGKVLYFVFSGGKVFNRESHRENEWNLVRLRNRDFRFDHVNNLLDHMITLDPKERYSAEKIVGEAKLIKRLIEGEYASLEGDRLSLCKYCGRGSYQPIVYSDQDFIHFHGFSASTIQGGGRGWCILVCETCGHVEYFRMDGAQIKWFPDKK